MTEGFLEYFGPDTLRDMPDIKALEYAGLLATGRTVLKCENAPLQALCPPTAVESRCQ
jgi:hypothetical protein